LRGADPTPLFQKLDLRGVRLVELNDLNEKKKVTAEKIQKSGAAWLNFAEIVPD